MDEVFRFDAEGVGNAVDVVEISDHLRGVVNGDIVQTGLAQPRHVLRCHLAWLGRQFFRIGAERAIDRVQPRRAPIARDGMYEGIRFGCAIKSFDLGTEVMRMRLNSVVAAVG